MLYFKIFSFYSHFCKRLNLIITVSKTAYHSFFIVTCKEFCFNSGFITSVCNGWQFTQIIVTLHSLTVFLNNLSLLYRN
jgi:hypothetical protein